MSRRVLLASFRREEDLLAAVRSLRREGHAPAAVHAPYAVHGLEQAAGMRRTRLPMVCAALGFAGAGAGFAFQLWASAFSWPLNVGGKPFNSLPAFVPVIFELGVLCAGVGTVLVFLVRSRLHPWRRPILPMPGLTDDRFLIALEPVGAGFDVDAVRRLLWACQAERIEERLLEGEI